MHSDSAAAVETAVIPVISPETVTPDAEAWQAVVRHLIVFRPVRGRGHPGPAGVGAQFYPRCRRAFSPIENDRLIDGAML
jgi:hypothetical protein